MLNPLKQSECFLAKLLDLPVITCTVKNRCQCEKSFRKKPGESSDAFVVFNQEDAWVEEGVEEEEEVAGDLFEDVEEPGEYRHVDPERVGVGVVLVLQLRLAWVQGVPLSGDRVQGVPLSGENWGQIVF